MDGDTASKFVSSLVKSIQALCNGYIDFSSSIEVIGHIHLRIDQTQKFNYVLSEEVSKSQSEDATVFASHSYHSQPPGTSGSATNTSRPSPAVSPSRNRRKTQHVARVDDSDTFTVSAVPQDVLPSSKDSLKYSDRLQSPTSARLSDSGDSRDADTLPGIRKREHGANSTSRSSVSSHDSLDRRRKLQSETHSTRSQDSAAKRVRRGSSGPAAVPNSGFEVIEIKEEPADDVSSDFYGDNNAAGQDISQPDFSNLVVESLDRVGQLEGASLLAGGDAQQMQMQQLRGQQDQPFPVMLHANPTASTSSGVSLPGPSVQQGAVASGGEFLAYDQGDQVSAEYFEYWQTTARYQADGYYSSEMPPGVFAYSRAIRPRMQYEPEDMQAAITEVDNGKSVRKAAEDHGIPLRSLYHRLKMRSIEREREEVLKQLPEQPAGGQDDASRNRSFHSRDHASSQDIESSSSIERRERDPKM